MLKKFLSSLGMAFLCLCSFFVVLGIWDDEDAAAEIPHAQRVEVVAQSEVPENRMPKDTIVPEEAKRVQDTKKPAPKVKVSETPSQTNEKGTEIDSRAIRVIRQLDSPRNLVNFFLDSTQEQDYAAACYAMDFSRIPELTPIEKQSYAFKLSGILNRLDDFYPTELPEKFEESECCLWPDHNYNAIQLVRREDGTWRFGPASVAEIPQFYNKIEHKVPTFTQQSWLKWCPDWMYYEVFDLAIIQWLTLVGFVFLGFIAYRIIPSICSRLVLFVMRFSSIDHSYTDLLHRALRPLADFTMVYIWYLGIKYVQVSPLAIQIAKLVMQPFCIIIMMITLLRLMDIFKVWLRVRLKDSSNKVRNVLVDLSTGIVKCVIICIGSVGIAQIFGFSALGIISGMGIGGIAVALAAQQTIANFFGSLTILMDRPFTVGDYIVVGDIEGKVETVGLRSTQIRTFYDSMVFMPNNQLASSTIDNMGHRVSRRYKTTLGMQYDTPVLLLRAFCDGIKRLIAEHPKTRKDDIRVHVHDLAGSSIDLELICYFVVRDLHEENDAREELIMGILSLAEKLGVSFAFPSQTTYVVPSENPGYTAVQTLTNIDEAKQLGNEYAESVLEANSSSTSKKTKTIGSIPFAA